MKKVYHLGTCSTCVRILKEVHAAKAGIVLQDIKTEKIIPEQLSEMIEMAGSAEALFSRKAMNFRKMGLHEQTLGENDYKELILSDYTFLKRPVFVLGDRIYIGNSKAVVEEVKAEL